MSGRQMRQTTFREKVKAYFSKSLVVTTRKDLEDFVDDRIEEIRRELNELRDVEPSGLKEFRQGLAKKFQLEGIPDYFLPLAESVGVAPDDADTVMRFKECVWKGKEPPNVDNIKESTNWVQLNRYSGMSAQRILTEEQRKIVQDFSFYWKERSPAFGSAMKQIRRFVIGKGVTTKASVEEVDVLWQAFLKGIKWEKRQKKIFEYGKICGELFFTLDFSDPMKMQLANIPYFETDFQEAVLVDSEDNDVTVGIARRKADQQGEQKTYVYSMWDMVDQPEVSDDLRVEFVPNKKAIHVIFYGNEDEVRGRPTYHSVLKYVKIWDDFVQNRARLNDFRSRVMMKKTVGEGGSAKVAGGGIQQMPKGGAILTETNKIKYEFMTPQINAGDVVDDAKLLMYMVCTGMEAPAHIVFQNAENNNYASIKETDTPFTQLVLDEQDEWKEFLDTLFAAWKSILISEKVLKASYRVTVLDPDGTKVTKDVLIEDCTIESTFPEMVKQSPQEKAAETKTLVNEVKVMSKRTAALRHNLDYEQEKKQIQVETDEAMKQQADRWQQLGITPGGGSPFDQNNSADEPA